jgi:hypothetical protein
MRKLMTGFRIPISNVSRPPFDAVYLYDLPKEERDTFYTCCDGMCNGTIHQGKSNGHPKFGQYVERKTYDRYYPKGSIREFEKAIEYVRGFFEKKKYKHAMFGAKNFSGSKGEIFIWFWQLKYNLHFRNHTKDLLGYVKRLLATLETLEELQ